MELIQRPRRLRRNEAVRRLCRETRVSPDSLIYPIFVDETLSGVRPIESLSGTVSLRPGQCKPGSGGQTDADLDVIIDVAGGGQNTA